MSRVGKEPINIPQNVETTIEGATINIKGPKGSLTQIMPESVVASREDNVLKVERASNQREHRALHGLMRSLLANMVEGVTEGFKKSLELVGVGYRVEQAGKGISLSLMMSHQVEIKPTEGVSIEVEGNNLIHVSGISKQSVGQTAAEIRKLRPPNPYTGKGIRYVGELVKIKPGKSARRVE